MPIYEYECADCETLFEELILRPGDETEVACPRCASRKIQRCLSPTAAAGGGEASPRSCGTFS